MEWMGAAGSELAWLLRLAAEANPYVGEPHVLLAQLHYRAHEYAAKRTLWRSG